MGSAMKRLSIWLNPLLIGVAGSGRIPLWAVVEHTGRRSGKRYRTPIAMRRTARGFVIPLPYGEGTDWCRNTIAANGCAVRWNGRSVPVGSPRVIDRADALPAFPWVIRRLIPAIGIRKFLEVTRVDSAAEAA